MNGSCTYTLNLYRRQPLATILWQINLNLNYLQNKKVSNILVEDPSAKGLLYFLATFLPVMQIWQDKSTYDARFVVRRWYRIVLRLCVEYSLKILGSSLNSNSLRLSSFYS